MRTRALAGVPFLAFIGLFLVYPTVIVLWRSVTPGGTPGTASLERAISDPYRSSFINSINLSLASALIGAVIGLALALAIYDLQRPRFLRAADETGRSASCPRLRSLEPVDRHRHAVYRRGSDAATASL